MKKIILTFSLNSFQGRLIGGHETRTLVQRQEQHHPDSGKADGQQSVPDIRVP